MRQRFLRGRRMLALMAFVLLLSIFPLAGTASAEYKTPTLDPVSFEFTTETTIDEGYAWVDDAGYHWRDTVYTGTATGDLTGEAVTLLNGDFAPNADCTDPTCGGDWNQGVLNMWGTLEITDEVGSWEGQFGYYLDQGNEQLGNTFLVGHQGYGGQAIAGDLVAPTFDSYASTGQRLTMTGPTGGVSVLFDACIPEAGDVSGGFILNASDFYDSGSVVAHYPLAQPDGTSAGEVVMVGEHGTLNATLLLQAQGSQHRIGYFMLLGGDGAYEGMYGFGWVRTSRWGNPSCPSGLGVGGSWIGESAAF